MRPGLFATENPAVAVALAGEAKKSLTARPDRGTESSIGVALRNQHAFRSRHLSRYLTRRAEASPVHESLQGAKLIRRTESDLETLSKDPDSPIRFRQTPEQEAERVWAQQLRPIF